MSELPIIATDKSAKRYILRRGGSAIITRSPKAGKQGYPSDALIVKTEVPKNLSRYEMVKTDDCTFYLDTNLTLRNYEQINVWIAHKWVFFKLLKARITVYRRIVL